ncbi:RING-box protein 2-like [Artemia franciscana]|uniref:RING-box protein 2-like n=1 Tax=Artemia franciscana TaxID=6661 RepID=UPI0032DB9DA2
MERFQSSSKPCEKENLVSSHLDKNDNIAGTEVNKAGKTFTLKKWNAVAMWSWDVECDTCAICRVQVMDACLKCQAENKSGKEDCVVIWGDCNHSFHNCCMAKWLKQNNRCPLCQQEWYTQRVGK